MPSLTAAASPPEGPGPHVYRHDVQIYYEDTDHSGFVYHANYLRYFERAREHVLGVPELVRMGTEDGVGFVVYRADIHYREAAVFGDSLQIRTTTALESPYRLVFQQDAYRGDSLLVKSTIQLACVDRNKRLVAIPTTIVERLHAPPAASESR
jgi:acyl-CoA thioester hydrolase